MGNNRSEPRDLTTRFGERIRELRERAGLSQADLADAADISKVYLGAVERAEKTSSLETVEKLARGLNMEPADLFAFKGRHEAEHAPAARMGRKVASLAQGASEGKIARFERIAKLYFEEEEEEEEG
jgi:transcriptional regulator with XRE-family HTH domain